MGSSLLFSRQQSLEGNREHPSYRTPAPWGPTLGRWETHGDLEEALGIYLVALGKALALEILFFLPFFPWDCWGRYQRRQVGKKEKGSRRQAEELIRTIRLHQTQRSRLPSRCTPQQCDATGWWPRRQFTTSRLLLPLLLNPAQLKALWEREREGLRRQVSL